MKPLTPTELILLCSTWFAIGVVTGTAYLEFIKNLLGD